MQQHCNLILNDRGALWLGDYESALNLEFLKSKGIRTVITVAAGLNLKFEGIVHHKIEILDIELTNISQYFQIANDWIERGFNIGGVLVHCMAGVSRSAAIVIAYLIEKKKMTYYQALNFVKSKRPQINPNKGFTNQLMSYATRTSQPPIPKSSRANHFQQTYDQFESNYYAPVNRKNSAGLIQQNTNFYKSITKSMSQSKSKNK
ncbi:unnamed protein product [Paramecium octaurelia]|uniref:protein-tyrosine-phosphatase n=1 Tax=Paramecium octaurelia TaxID=43137 RepID=A0A8S1UKQ7_PAROT|nr:unnamed protein product [Paramecium octaurelia]CAD8164281.1 unnamed protein product [Paramecium octaurelia]